MPSKIEYRKGDATKPTETGVKIIVHIVNDIGAWGKGFVVALSRKWPVTRQKYLQWHAGKLPDASPFGLGQMLPVNVEKDFWVANIIGQHGLANPRNPTPIDYTAVKQGLVKVAEMAKLLGASVCGPRFGAGLAGGDWKKIEQLINDYVCIHDIPVTIYDL